VSLVFKFRKLTHRRQGPQSTDLFEGAKWCKLVVVPTNTYVFENFGGAIALKVQQISSMFQQLNRVVNSAFLSLLCSLRLFQFHNNPCRVCVWNWVAQEKCYQNIAKRESMKVKLERVNQNGRRGLQLHSLVMEANLCVLPVMLHSIITKPETWSVIMKKNTKNFATNYPHTSRN